MPRYNSRPMGLQKVLSENLKTVRRTLGVTQQDLADKMDIPRSYISDIERCHVSPTLAIIERLSAALGVDAHVLLMPTAAAIVAGGKVGKKRHFA